MCSIEFLQGLKGKFEAFKHKLSEKVNFMEHELIIPNKILDIYCNLPANE